MLSTGTLCSHMWAVHIKLCMNKALHTQTYQGCHIQGPRKDIRTWTRNSNDFPDSEVVSDLKHIDWMCVWPSLKLCCVHSKQPAGTALAAAQILHPPSKHAHWYSLTPASPHPASYLKGAAGCPGSRISEPTALPFQCCSGQVTQLLALWLLPSHTVMQKSFSSATGPHYLVGHCFIFHPILVTALILRLFKFRQALEKTIFLAPLISPATHSQLYRW